MNHFLISLFIVLSSFHVGAQTQTATVEDETVFVLVGYRAIFDVPETEALLAEKAQRYAEVVQGAFAQWQKETDFSIFEAILEGREVSIDVFLKTEKEAHFLIRPVVFVGVKSKLSLALGLNQKKIETGEFKVEEIKESSYFLLSTFGFYEKESQEIKPYWTSFNKKEIPFSSILLSFEDKEKTLKDLISIYKAGDEFKKPVRHLVRHQCVHLGYLDISWMKNEFIPPYHYERGMIIEMPNGKAQMIIGVSEDIQEL